eukprot:CAMPEP_0179105778 /NCGR_PEP_ID=MMETSP0796-20121207/49142_1 /TAXON_ID=73915 /ORGANISM="Pyrodinium bahamense, Strain pbaha01" /LENGTH=80 /DNA_ID=CAMNT_0020803773 /DNA_START=287 /DNA_END=527 /DNA_ORIENTATION=-
MASQALHVPLAPDVGTVRPAAAEAAEGPPLLPRVRAEKPKLRPRLEKESLGTRANRGSRGAWPGAAAASLRARLGGGGGG